MAVSMPTEPTHTSLVAGQGVSLVSALDHVEAEPSDDVVAPGAAVADVIADGECDEVPAATGHDSVIPGPGSTSSQPLPATTTSLPPAAPGLPKNVVVSPRTRSAPP